MIQNIVKMSINGWKLILNSHKVEALLWTYAGYEIYRGAKSVQAMKKARKDRIAVENELERVKAEKARKEAEAKAEKEAQEKEAEEYLEKVKREMEEAKKNDPMKKEIDRLLRSADRLLNED